jgi:hypothetical protein
LRGSLKILTAAEASPLAADTHGDIAGIKEAPAIKDLTMVLSGPKLSGVGLEIQVSDTLQNVS